MTKTLHEHIEEASQGNQESVKALIGWFDSCFRAYTRNFARSLLLDADDLHQECLVELLNWIQEYQEQLGASWASFVSNRVRWRCRDFARQRGNHPVCNFRQRGSGNTVSREAATDDEEFLDVLGKLPAPPQQDNEGFKCLLHDLPEQLQYILTRYYVDGLYMREIGEELQLSDSAIWQKIKAAHGLIRQRLEREQFDEKNTEATRQAERLEKQNPTGGCGHRFALPLLPINQPHPIPRS